jgi:hypothetical protein
MDRVGAVWLHDGVQADIGTLGGAQVKARGDACYGLTLSLSLERSGQNCCIRTMRVTFPYYPILEVSLIL